MTKRETTHSPNSARHMIDRLTIDKLRNLPIEKVAERLGMKVIKHKTICPFHNDTHASLTFHTTKNSFRCFVCDEHGSGSIDLVMKVEHLGFAEACQWLADENNISTMERKAWQKPKPTSDIQTTDVEHLIQLLSKTSLNADAKRFLYSERRITTSVVETMGIKAIDRPMPMTRNPNGLWFNAPALIIPYHGLDGSLLSVQARWLGGRERARELDIPRFQFPRGSHPTIYNMPVLNSMDDGEELWVAEGVTDCLALMSWGKKAIAIPSATLLTSADIELLRDRNLHIAPDQDAAGERLFLNLRNHLPDITRHQLPEGCKDFGEAWEGRVLNFEF